MNARYFGLVLGVMFLLIGILGFVPALVTHPPAGHDHLSVTGPGHGYLLGIFHVNVIHNLVHILFGVWGILASGSFSSARMYSKIVAVSYATFAVMGLFPVLDTVFGLIPIHGNDVWLHLVIAAAATYFGFANTPIDRPVAISRGATLGDDIRV